MPTIPQYQQRVGVPRSVPRTDTFRARELVNPAEGAVTLAASIANVVQHETKRREDQALIDYDLQLSQADQKAWIGDPDNPGAAASQGRNAAGITSATLAAWDKQAEALTPKLRSPEAQARAAQARAVRRQDLQSRLTTHEVQQGRVADAETFESAKKTYTGEAVANSDDPGAVDASLARGRGAIAAYAKRNGWDDVQTTEKLADWESGTVRSAIAAQLTRDPLKALETFKRRVDTLRDSDRIAVEGALRPYVLDKQGRAIGGSLYQGGAPTVAAGTPSLYDAIALTESGDKQFDATGAVIRGPTTANGQRAVGRFQIMPGTGPEAARMAGLPWDAKRFENDETYHAQLGRAYIDAQVERFGGNVPVVAAAYNMGPEAAAAWAEGRPYKTASGKQWTPKGPMDMAALPTETRDYIAKVTDRMGGMPGAAPAPDADPETAIAHRESDALRRAYLIENLDDRRAAIEDVRFRAGVDRMAVQEDQRAKTEAAAQLKDKHENNLARLADGVDVPVTERLSDAQLLAVYGPVEGPHMIANQNTLIRTAPDRSLLPTATPEQTKAILAKYKPDPKSAEYAFEANVYKSMATAAQDIADRRQADPMLFAAQSGLYGVKPINPAQPDGQWQARDKAARLMESTYGTPYKLLSADEATAYTAQLSHATAMEKLDLLGKTRGTLSERGFQSVMGQVAGDQPLTAAAGSLLGVGDQSLALSNGQRITGKQVATTILAGQELLDPPKGGTKAVIAAESLLAQSFNIYIGSAYAGQPKAQAQAFQAFRAYYAARAGQKGLLGQPELDRDLAEESAQAVTGGVAEVNDSHVVLPWGVSEDAFTSQAERIWPELRAMAGLPETTPFARVGFQPAGGDRYYVMAGDTPLTNTKNGAPLLMIIGRPKPPPPRSSPMSLGESMAGDGF